MKKFNQVSIETLPRNNSLSRSKSQNHYYIQANQFQKRYQNSLINSYRLNSSRRCPPCCNANTSRGFQSQMTFNENDYSDDNYNKNASIKTEYYDNSFLKNQTSNAKNQLNTQMWTNLQTSKRYLQELVEKSQTNFKIHKQKAQNQIQSLQRLLHQKDDEIYALNKEVSRLKKISMETGPMKSTYTNQGQTSLIEIQRKDQAIKQLQRKINKLRQENSYFRQDFQIKNKQIQQLKSKYKLKEENDLKTMQQMQSQINMTKQQKKHFIEKLNQLESNCKQWKQSVQIHKNQKNRLTKELNTVRLQFQGYKEEYDQTKQQSIEKIKLYESNFLMLKGMSHQKDVKIQGLISKLNCIQSELNFFKDKFTNLLLEIEREERQSVLMYEKAHSLKENGEKVYEELQKIRQSEIIQLDSHKTSRLQGYTGLDLEHKTWDAFQRASDHRTFDSNVFTNRKVGGKQTSLKNYYNKEEDYIMMESGLQFAHKFPSLNMSISPIHNRQ